MGHRQSLSLEKRQYIKVLKQIFKANGANINEEQLQHMLKTVLGANPWFLKHSTLHVGLRERAGAVKRKHNKAVKSLFLP